MLICSILTLHIVGCWPTKQINPVINEGDKACQAKLFGFRNAYLCVWVIDSRFATFAEFHLDSLRIQHLGRIASSPNWKCGVKSDENDFFRNFNEQSFSLTHFRLLSGSVGHTLYNTQNTDNSVYHRQKMALIRFSFWNCELSWNERLFERLFSFGSLRKRPNFRLDPMVIIMQQQ